MKRWLIVFEAAFTKGPRYVFVDAVSLEWGCKVAWIRADARGYREIEITVAALWREDAGLIPSNAVGIE